MYTVSDFTLVQTTSFRRDYTLPSFAKQDFDMHYPLAVGCQPNSVLISGVHTGTLSLVELDFSGAKLVFAEGEVLPLLLLQIHEHAILSI